MKKRAFLASAAMAGCLALQPLAAFAQFTFGNAVVPPSGGPMCNGFSAAPGQLVSCASLTKFTASGCSAGTTVGGPTMGTVTLGANTCSLVITMNGAMGATAPNGWTCQAHDRTAPTVLIGGEASSNATTATITIPAGAGTTDAISFSCTPY